MGMGLCGALDRRETPSADLQDFRQHPAGLVSGPAVCLLAFSDKLPGLLWPGAELAGLCRRRRDVRGAVDLCHRDGSIKREVAANPEK
jgi:hypothetical protein